MSSRPRATASPEFDDTGDAVVVQELRNPITGIILRATSLNRAIDRTRTWSQIKPLLNRAAGPESHTVAVSLPNYALHAVPQNVSSDLGS
jgi:hypothetical protein